MRQSRISEFLPHVQIRHVWIFLTEKCNLSCDYCFSADRDNRTTLSIRQLTKLFDALVPGGNYDVVISGGEPLVEWERARAVIRLIRQRFESASVTLQTNGLLLDKKKIEFFLSMGVRLEFGLDGPLSVNAAHRRGICREGHARLLENIRLAASAGVLLGGTMTVHPQETRDMLENFLSLSGIGLRMLEVHPAFLADWRREQAVAFERGYRRIMAFDAKEGQCLVGKNYSLFVPPCLDLVVEPRGRVLPNWTYLAFPKSEREPFYLMDLSGRGIAARLGPMAVYCRDLTRFFKHPRTYREFSNFNAQRILEFSGRRSFSNSFISYTQACAAAQRIDQRSLSVVAGIQRFRGLAAGRD
jgi:MoaA/NifB/PqqE/SkfB family radical SAM enzyme